MWPGEGGRRAEKEWEEGSENERRGRVAGDGTFFAPSREIGRAFDSTGSANVRAKAVIDGKLDEVGVDVRCGVEGCSGIGVEGCCASFSGGGGASGVDGRGGGCDSAVCHAS